MRILRNVLGVRESLLVACIVIIGILMSFLSPYFLQWPNLSALLLGLSVNGIVTVGMVVLLVSGVFDLSVGSALTWAGVAAGLLLKGGTPVAIATIVGVAAAGCVGLVNGIIVAVIEVNAFITTLVTAMIVQGVVLLSSGGSDIPNLPAAFNAIGQGSIGRIQYPIPVLFVVVIVFDILLRKNRFFRFNYYVGENEKAAVLSGINVLKVRLFGFVLCSVLAGVAGIMITARFGTASLVVGQDIPLSVIAAAVLGGCSLNGGEGTVVGGVLGSMLLLLVVNALNLLGVNVYWQDLVTGVVLLTAVIINRYTNRRRGRLA